MTALSAERMPKPTLADGYTARHLTVLEGLEAVRKRPGMYIGSTDGRGLLHCLWELIDNAVDEALGGHCTKIEVILHDDDSAEVRDNGRGIPVDIEPKTKLNGVELVMTRLHAGGKFGGGSYTASGGLHGVGASVVNALASRLDVEVDKDGAQWAMSFRRGVPGEFSGPGPGAAFQPGSGLRKVRRVAKTVTGTRIRFWPDQQVFVRGAVWRFDALAQRARQTAYLVPGLTIRIVDERGDADRAASLEEGASPADGLDDSREAEFCFDGGISEFCAHLSTGEPVTDVVRLTGSGQFTETVPVLDDQGHLVPTDVERELEVDVALRWDGGYGTATRSFVNVIATPKGGTHVAGFERALVRTLNEQLRAVRLLKNGDEPVTKEDILEGLTAVIAVRLPEPQFEGQTKEVLGTPAATRIVGQVVASELRTFFESAGAGQAAGAGGSGQGGRRRQDPDLRPRAPREPAAQVGARDVRAAGEAGRLPLGRRPERAVHRGGRLRARHGEAGQGLRVPGAAADPRQDPQRAEGVADRHAQERRVRRDHPGPRRRARAPRSTWTRPGTSGSSSWPTPTWTARTSGPCCSPSSTATCGRWWRRAGCSPPCRRCTGSS